MSSIVSIDATKCQDETVPLHQDQHATTPSDLTQTPPEQPLPAHEEVYSISIVDYDDALHNHAFKAMSVAWISEFWVVEERDLEEFDHVQANILDVGGFILMAVMDRGNGQSEPVGCIAMVPPLDKEKYDYELAKFTTTSAARGRGLGRKLMAQALEKAKNKNMTRIYLETNNRCHSAIHLYEQFGFVHIPGHSPVYQRGDTLMTLNM